MGVAFLYLVLLVAATCSDAGVLVPLLADDAQRFSSLFSQATTLANGVVTILPDNNVSYPVAQLPAGISSFTLRGLGEVYIPQIAITRWPYPPGYNANLTIASGNQSLAVASPEPFTLLDFNQLKNQLITSPFFPAIELLQGQELTLTSLSLYLAEISDVLGPPNGGNLATLAFTEHFIRIHEGATLRLENVTVVVYSNDFSRFLNRSLCTTAERWSYAPDVKLTRSEFHITSLTTRAPDATGKRGAGGEVQWRNVRFLYGGATNRTWMLPVCAAAAVSNGAELLKVTREMLNETFGRLYISLTADMALPQDDGKWEPIILQATQQLVLLGDPAQPPTLDLAGRFNVWRAQELGPRGDTLRAVAALYNMTIVNLPYMSAWPNGTMSSLVSGLHTFSVNRGSLVQDSSIFRLTVVNCTLVVPDPELQFLDNAYGRAANDSWPGEPPGGFVLEVQQTPSDNQAAQGRLEVLRMRFMSEVMMSSSVLLSASQYSTLPGAVQLWPGSQLWLPQLLARRDQATVQQWGVGGLAASYGLYGALKLASNNRRPGYNPVQLIGRRLDDDSVTADFLQLVDPAAAPPPPPANGDAAATSTVAVRYVVDSFPEDVLGGRVYVNLRGLQGRVLLARPILLRNLVLYNLAPGGMYPINRTGAPLTEYDIAWTGIALPLWFFNFSRSSQDMMMNSTFRFSPLLQLVNVTLLVREDEWRAMVTDVLRQHAPETMEQAQQRQGSGSSSRPAAPAATPMNSSAVPQQYLNSNNIILTALRAFAATSKLLSYDYASRSLVLSEATHLGWTGTNITLISTHVLPPDAPIVPSDILSYQGIDLPYQELSGSSLNLDFQVNVTSPSIYTFIPSGPQTMDSSVNAISGQSSNLDRRVNVTSPPTSTIPSAPQTAEGSATKPPVAPTPSAPTPTASSFPSPPGLPAPAVVDQNATSGTDSQPKSAPDLSDTTEAPHHHTTGDHPSWVVPVAASGGVTACVLLLVVLIVLARRRSLRASHSTVWNSQSGGGYQKGLGQGMPQAEQTVVVTLAPEDSDGDTAAANRLTPRNPAAREAGKEFGCQRDGVNRLQGSGSSNFMQTPAATSGATEVVASEENMPTAAVSENKRILEKYHGAVARALARAINPSQLLTASSSISDQQCGAATNQDFGQDLLFDGELESHLSALLRDNPVSSCKTSTESGAADSRTLNAMGSLEGYRIGPGWKLLDSIRSLQMMAPDEDFIAVGVIGSGSSGVVYRGVWRGLEVAMKTVVIVDGQGGRSGDDSTEPTRSQAVMEAAISLSMAHPNVVATYSYNVQPLVQQPPAAQGQYGGGPDALELHNCYKLSIVQEYCNGGTLRQALDCGRAGSVRAGGLSQRLALRLAQDVALGLANIHSGRIVHGDLKPGNVLLMVNKDTVNEEGSQCTSKSALTHSITGKIADFGLSLLLEQGATHASGRFHGTLAYKAPEVLSSGLLSPRSDVWSFGVMLLELFYGCTMAKMAAIQQALSGGAEAGDSTPAQTLTAILLKDMLASSHLLYDKLAAACLAEDPHARPGIVEVVSKLQGLCNDLR